MRQPAEGSVSEGRTGLRRSSRCQGVPADLRRAQAPEGARADVELRGVTVISEAGVWRVKNLIDGGDEALVPLGYLGEFGFSKIERPGNLVEVDNSLAGCPESFHLLLVHGRMEDLAGDGGF